MIDEYMRNRHPEVRAQYEELAHWKDLPQLGPVVGDDQMLVVITARIGTVSYKPAFERLPIELTDSFPTCSLIIVYPDQHGQPQDVMTFTAPQQQDSESAYATVMKIIEKFKK